MEPKRVPNETQSRAAECRMKEERSRRGRSASRAGRTPQAPAGADRGFTHHEHIAEAPPRRSGSFRGTSDRPPRLESGSAGRGCDARPAHGRRSPMKPKSAPTGAKSATSVASEREASTLSIDLQHEEWPGQHEKIDEDREQPDAPRREREARPFCQRCRRRFTRRR